MNLPALPNLNQIRATTDSTVADALQETVAYVNANVTPVVGNRVAPPPLHVVDPTRQNG